MAKDVWPMKVMVEVDWLDSCSRGKWGSGTEYAAESYPLLCRSAGYLLKKTKKVVAIVQSQAPNGTVNDSITIPRSCVLKIRRVK